MTEVTISTQVMFHIDILHSHITSRVLSGEDNREYARKLETQLRKEVSTIRRLGNQNPNSEPGKYCLTWARMVEDQVNEIMALEK